MDANEEYIKVQLKYQQFLNSLTEDERRQLVKQRKHAVSCCKLDGEYWPTLDEKENLFEVVGQMKRYVVDTNSNWQAESAKPENRDKAFILGKTITDEQDDLRGLFLVQKSNWTITIFFYLACFSRVMQISATW